MNIPIRAGDTMVVFVEGGKQREFIFHAKVFHDLAVATYKRVLKSPQESARDILAAIICACTALEGFIAETVVGARASGKVTGDQKATELADAITHVDKRKGKGERKGIKEKYREARRVLKVTTFRDDEPVFRDFALLVDLRNTVVHLEPFEVGADQARQQVLLRKLSSLGIIPVPSHSFLENLTNPEVARFACNAAASMIREIASYYKHPWPGSGLEVLHVVGAVPEPNADQMEDLFPMIPPAVHDMTELAARLGRSSLGDSQQGAKHKEQQRDSI